MSTGIAKKVVLKIDVTDWDSEFQQEEPNISDGDAIIKELLDGRSTAQLARFAIVARERKQAPEDIVGPNKLLLQAGARADIAARYVARMKEVEGQDGETRKVREVVALPNGNGRSREFVGVEDSRATDAARHYLLVKIPGHVFNRIEIIATNEGVATAHDDLEELIKLIREIQKSLK